MTEPTHTDKIIEENENIEKTIELFNNIYKVVLDDEFKKIDEDERHQILIGKYKDLSNMYPCVVRIMARNFRYNETALRKMLIKMRDEGRKLQEERKKNMKMFSAKKDQKRDPVKSMTKFVEYQADYAKFLYLEENKKNGKHYSMKIANDIWNGEYKSMIDYFKKVRDQEEKNKNEFEEEKKKNLELRRAELLDFINSQNFDDFGDTEDVTEPKDSEPEISKDSENIIPANDVSSIVNSLETHLSGDTNENHGHLPKEDAFDKENFDSYVSEIINCKESFEKAGNVAEKLSEVQIREYSDEIISRLQAIENAINDGFIKQTDYEQHVKDAKYCIDILNAAVNMVNTVNVEIENKEISEENEWLVGTSVDRAKSGKKKITKKKK